MTRLCMLRMVYVGALALQISACQYAGALGLYDFSMAASPTWVVTLSNSQVCRERTWSPADLSHRFSESCRTIDSILSCGMGGVTDPHVVYDTSSNRWFYVTLAGLNGRYCLSSAPESDPFAIDRGYRLDPSLFGNETDFPQLVVTGNKIVITSARPGHGDSWTRIFNKQDLLANAVSLRSASINHAEHVTLAGTVGNGDPAVWVRPKLNAMTIGLITGVPGAGGVFTTSAEVLDPGSNPNCTFVQTPAGLIPADGFLSAQAVYRTRGSNGAVWTLTCSDDRHTQNLVRFDQLAPTFNPVRGYARGIGRANEQMYCGSLSVDPNDRALVGLGVSSSSLWPSALIAAFKEGALTLTPQFIGVGRGDRCPPLRFDFCPRAAAFLANEWWLGVGFQSCVDDDTGYGWFFGKSGVFCRENGGHLCTR